MELAYTYGTQGTIIKAKQGGVCVYVCVCVVLVAQSCLTLCNSMD